MLEEEQSAMLVVFQRRILYMGGLPPGSRSTVSLDYRTDPTKADGGLKLVDFENPLLRPFDCSHVEVGKLRGVQISRKSKENTILVYFQGTFICLRGRMRLISKQAISDPPPNASLCTPPFSPVDTLLSAPSLPSLLDPSTSPAPPFQLSRA